MGNFIFLNRLDLFCHKEISLSELLKCLISVYWKDKLRSLSWRLRKILNLCSTKLNYNCDKPFYINTIYVLWFVGLNVISNIFNLNTFVLNFVQLFQNVKEDCEVQKLMEIEKLVGLQKWSFICFGL